MQNGLIRIIPLVLFCLVQTASAQVETTQQPVAGSDTLRVLLRKAQDEYLNFRNGPAFSGLLEYAALRQKTNDAAVTAGLEREVARHEAETGKVKDQLRELEASVTALQNDNHSLADEKKRLLYNTWYLIVALAAFAGLLLFLFHRRMTQEEERQVDGGIRLENTTILAGLAVNSESLAADTRFSFTSVDELIPKVQDQVGKLRAISATLAKKSEPVMNAEAIMSRIHELAANGKSALEQFEGYFAADDEKRSSNLNAIIDDTAHLSYLWMKSRYGDFECALSLDLEKILPEISIYPGSVRKALFCFFNNAFYSVYRQAVSKGVGFEGRVTVISRQLPRFVQVRIRDNGQGVDEKNREKVFEPFFSTSAPEHGAGLGLSFGKQIICDRHQGELSFENDTGYGTDLLVRFPIEIR